ncbi:uncharacterized protein LOC105185902 [Harpegnathos saltator]|uniref:uncharacterized protein LOC105185902 n=1 Tax=Harpegnathos saltator TaxID=610380 RepID=UPI000DBEF172|nr:uncharacterized protein LOC105185902 [Harpegnathos saltator]
MIIMIINLWMSQTYKVHWQQMYQLQNRILRLKTLQTLFKKNERKQISTIARFLESCQKSKIKLSTDIVEGKNIKNEIQKELLNVYQKIRIAEEECVEQLKKANKLKEEKNRLLKEFLHYSVQKNEMFI